MNAAIMKLKKEAVNLALVLVALLVIFKIVFYNEGVGVLVRTVVSLYWLIVLPGFYLIFFWHNKLSFFERLIISLPIGAALLGISSYYLGIIGLPISLHHIVIPIVVLAVAGYVNRKELFSSYLQGIR